MSRIFDAAGQMACSLVLLAGCTCDPTFDSEHGTRYDTVDAARADDLFGRAWLPEVLPSDSGPILEAHDSETHLRCARAGFPKARAEGIVRALLEYGFDTYTGEIPAPPALCPFRRPWRRSEKRGAVTAFRNGEEDEAYAIVDATGFFYYWAAPEAAAKKAKPLAERSN